MGAQAESKPVHIVADSTGDIPERFVLAHNIDIIHAKLIFPSQEYTDGVDITRSEFLTKLVVAPKPPTTASPGEKPYMDIYEKHPEPIVTVSAGSSFSSLYEHAVMAARDMKRTNILSHDTESASLGAGFSAMHAAELAEQGMAAQEIISRLEDMRKRTYVIALLNELKYLRASGKMSLPQLWAASLLGLKPILGVKDNVAFPIDAKKTKKDAYPAFISWIQSHAPFERLGVVHAGNEPFAREVVTALSNDFNKDDVVVAELSPGVATHVGPGTVGVIFVTKNQPAA